MRERLACVTQIRRNGNRHRRRRAALPALDGISAALSSSVDVLFCTPACAVRSLIPEGRGRMPQKGQMHAIEVEDGPETITIVVI